MQGKLVGTVIIVALLTLILIAVFAGRRSPSVSDPTGESAPCSARLQELREYEKASEDQAQQFVSHASALLRVAASQSKNPGEFLNAKMLQIESGETADSLRFSSTLAEVYGSVCSDRDRAKLVPVVAAQIDYLSQNLQFIQKDVQVVGAHTTDSNIKERAIQMSRDLANSLLELQSLKSKLR